MTQTSEPQESEGWKPYDLDHSAQEIVLKHRGTKNVLNESHKMRMAVAYGLERFWGEHLRLQRENRSKSQYWKDVWNKLAEILNQAGFNLPNRNVISITDTQTIREVAGEIWSMTPDQQRIALMVLTQFCDALVWWTQRYKQTDNSSDPN